MNDYLFLMHDDAESAETAVAWTHYLKRLRESGQFDGGSAIAGGECVTQSSRSDKITSHLTGYLRVRAETLEAAKRLLEGNPVFEAGGTVEIRELPRD
ncbi:hypothetical protein BH10PSE17_BH10PSE17_23990 [soil metagenome]